MFEDIVSALLTRFLGEYIEGVSAKDLSISVLRPIEMNNLVFPVSGGGQGLPGALPPHAHYFP